MRRVVVEDGTDTLSVRNGRVDRIAQIQMKIFFWFIDRISEHIHNNSPGGFACGNGEGAARCPIIMLTNAGAASDRGAVYCGEMNRHIKFGRRTEADGKNSLRHCLDITLFHCDIGNGKGWLLVQDVDCHRACGDRAIGIHDFEGKNFLIRNIVGMVHNRRGVFEHTVMNRHMGAQGAGVIAVNHMHGQVGALVVRVGVSNGDRRALALGNGFGLLVSGRRRIRDVNGQGACCREPGAVGDGVGEKFVNRVWNAVMVDVEVVISMRWGEIDVVAVAANGKSATRFRVNVRNRTTGRNFKVTNAVDVND